MMFHRCQVRRSIVIAASIITVLLYIFCTIFTRELFPSDSIACYRIKGESLPNILNETPSQGKSIFFHETSCNSFINGKIEITARQACAVESAAKMNPNYEVYLLFTSPGLIKYEGTESDRILRSLLSYKNLKIRHLDYESYTKGSPLEKFYDDRRVESSKYARSHASDVLRYLTLWRYGGIYLDLDVVVIKSLETLPPNYAGSESDNNVAAGVINFGASGKGRQFAEMCINDLRDNFRGDDWGNNGPGVITRLSKKLCKAKRAKEMLHKNCNGFKVYPPETFYVVPWPKWHMYFDPHYNNKLLKMVDRSYAIHVWNKHSINTKVNVTQDVPYSIFAKKYCPKVFAECDTYF